MDNYFGPNPDKSGDIDTTAQPHTPQEKPPVAPPNANQYYQPVQPPQSGQYYQPPQQPIPPQQPYYRPPVAPNPNGKKPKKKRNKTVFTLLIIIVLCVLVAVVGINFAIKNGDNKLNSFKGDDNNTSQSEQKDADDGEDVASVVGSDEAEKKDSNGNLTAAGVAEKAIDSCVGITVYTEQSNYNYFYNYGSDESNGGSVASGEGSGVIMAEKNGKTYIMTCAHVIADGTSFVVTLNDDTELEATMVGYDSQTDIGVLALNKTGLQVATFGDSADIELGEPCVAIGCPGGLEFKNSVTQGIVSALARPIKSNIGYNNECIQVDAAINPGNSGGALFNMQGQVIGINSSKIASTDYEGMGFAVPSNTAIATANSLIKNGYVAGRAKLGVTYNTLSSYRSASSILSALEKKGFKNAQGTMVIQEVAPESDLSNKDIKQYDMIVAVNGDTLTSTDVMTTVLSKSKPGDTVKLTVARVTDNNEIKISEIECKLIEDK